jgi:hypothetical protein
MMDGPDVIFMSMCDDNANNFIGFAAQIFVIGNNVINPDHIVTREHHARIYDQYLVVKFVGGHVLAHFP